MKIEKLLIFLNCIFSLSDQCLIKILESEWNLIFYLWNVGQKNGKLKNIKSDRFYFYLNLRPLNPHLSAYRHTCIQGLYPLIRSHWYRGVQRMKKLC